MHKTRREEAFDSSAVLMPPNDLKQYKLVRKNRLKNKHINKKICIFFGLKKKKRTNLLAIH